VRINYQWKRFNIYDHKIFKGPYFEKWQGRHEISNIDKIYHSTEIRSQLCGIIASNVRNNIVILWYMILWFSHISTNYWCKIGPTISPSVLVTWPVSTVYAIFQTENNKIKNLKSTYSCLNKSHEFIFFDRYWIDYEICKI